MKTRILFILLSCWLSGTLQAQCFEDRHGTNAFDAWISCEKSENPVHGGMSHWIEYDLHSLQTVNDIHIWNLNHPNYLKSGVKDIIVDVFANGNWSTVDTFTVTRASSSGQYEGMLAMDLNDVAAEKLLFTVLNNHGGGCSGFSEIRIYTDNVSSAALNLAFSPCENGGVYKNLSAGLELSGGYYHGLGVIDNGDGTFDYDVGLLGAGVRTIYYNYGPDGTQSMSTEIEILSCKDNRCPICDECEGTTDALQINMNPIPEKVYKAEEISSVGTVNTDLDVEFHAREGIVIGNGFMVNKNSDFTAIIRSCDVNILQNSKFESGLEGWHYWNNEGDGGMATFEATTEDPYEGTQCAKIAVQAVGSEDYSWQTQMSQDEFTVEAGTTYRFSFAARTLDAKSFDFVIQENETWEVFKDVTIDAKPYWETYEFQFTTPRQVNDLRVVFEFGKFEGSYFLDDVRMVKN